jgi:hypothetical protein
MSTQRLTTQIYLPPGVPTGAVIRELLQRAFEKYRWFSPARFGMAFLDGRLDPNGIDFAALRGFYEERKTLCVAARTDRDFLLIFPSKPDDPPYTGKITWVTSARVASTQKWRMSHAEQVAEVMRLVHSPLAIASVDEDIERKTQRLVPEGGGLKLTFTVRGYGQGLAGLFWRNFFGPPFVRMFGERLATLPEDCREPLGDDLVLVQPYELPTEAGKEHGNARERTLTAHLGPECFYDHEHHTPPTRRPVLDDLSESLQ